MIKHVIMFLFFAMFFACNQDEPTVNNGNPDTSIEDEELFESSKSKDKGSSYRVNVTGGSVTLIIDSPVDGSGNVIINSSGSTTVGFRVVISRTSATSDIHLQFQIRNTNLTNFYTSGIIRTLDFAPSQLDKTISGSFNVTAAGVAQGNYDLCLFIRDFIVVQDTTGDCKNTVIGTLPVPGVGDIEPDWIFDSGTCAFREIECVPRSLQVYLGTGGDIPGASIAWSGGESYITWLPGSLPPENRESIRFITKSGVAFPTTFTITARVSRPGYSDVIRTRSLTLHNCCFIED